MPTVKPTKQTAKNPAVKPVRKPAARPTKRPATQRAKPPFVPAGFDPDAAATGDGLFGLAIGPKDARIVVIPVPFDATTSYGDRKAHV